MKKKFFIILFVSYFFAGTAFASEPVKTMQAAVKADANGYIPVTLETLSGFEADWLNPDEEEGIVPNPFKNKKIPQSIKDLNGKKVAINGFVFPTDMDEDKMTGFLLLKYIPGCFFCEMPRANDWVRVTLKDTKSLKDWTDQPVIVYGTLEVGEEKENGFVTSFYRLKTDSMKLFKAK